MVDKVKGGVKRGCVHFDTPSFLYNNTYSLLQYQFLFISKYVDF